MKRFMYFAHTDGGMECSKMTESDFNKPFLYSWMSDSCRQDDEKLLKWTKLARVGEYHEHRLGVCVRLADEDGSP